MNKLFPVLLILLALVSCKDETQEIVDVSHIEMHVEIDRFDRKFYNTSDFSLEQLKQSYPFLFPEMYHDTIWSKRRSDVFENELFKKVDAEFGDFSQDKAAIEDVFKRVAYYFPSFEAPKVYTLVSNLDTESKVIYANPMLFVSLDMFLGSQDTLYSGFPEYMIHKFDRNDLPVAVGEAFAEQLVGFKRARIFLNQMIAEGKKLYLLNKFVPSVSEKDIMGYADVKYDWITSNESEIWKYFIENDLLYSTDTNLYHRFMADAPFSKFYIDIDLQSPGRVGSWIGWKIVQSYMKNNNVTLQELLQTDADQLFKQSKYKPKK